MTTHYSPLITSEKQKRFLSDLRTAIQEAIEKKATLEEIKKNINLSNYSHLGFQAFLSADSESVYYELTNEKKEQ